SRAYPTRARRKPCGPRSPARSTRCVRPRWCAGTRGPSCFSTPTPPRSSTSGRWPRSPPRKDEQMHRLMILASLVLAMVVGPGARTGLAQTGAAPLRVGLIGLDTSHVVAFTRLLNDPAHPDHVPGARVVAAFKGGSPDVEASAT